MNMTQTYTNYLNMNMDTNVKMDKNMDKVREHVHATSNWNFVILANSWLGENWPQNKVCRLAQGEEKLQNRFFSLAASMVNSQVFGMGYEGVVTSLQHTGCDAQLRVNLYQ